MTSPDERPAPPARYCAGKIHAELGLPAALDPVAKTGPSRVGLIEDGAVFCMSCARDLARGGWEA
jgi:hypothetical protein